MQTAARDILVGRSLEGRYRILDRVARGGMSTVYAAVDERLDRLVAVKVMASALSADPAFNDRFAREARAAARLTHLNAVSVYDQGHEHGPDGHHVFLVMELVEGRTLRELLRERGRLSAAQAVSIMEPVLSALSAAHRAGLVHRDVKPENILLSDDGVVKVADFGLARAVESDAASTRTGLMMGTVAYCSPEQISRGAADPRSDVYSAGIVLFELLTGEPPYRGDSAMNVAWQHVHSRVPAPSSKVKPAGGIPYQLDELVVAATDSDPTARPGDAGAMLAELADVRAELSLPVVPVPPRERGASRDRRAHHQSRPRTPDLATTDTMGRIATRHDTVVAGDGPLAGAAGTVAPPRRFGRGVDSPRRAGGQRGADATLPAGGALPGGSGRPPVAGRAAGGPPPPIVIPPGASRNAAGQRGGQPRRRRRALLVVLLILLLGLGAGWAGWWFAAGRYARVPSVRGDSSAEAVTALHQAGFGHVQVAPGPEFDDSGKVPKDQVLRTNPSATTRAVSSTVVTVVLSAGPHYYSVARVRNQSEAGARSTLLAVGPLDIAERPKLESSMTVGKNKVIGTIPAAGAQVTKRQPITIILSTGPPILQVPEIDPGTPLSDAEHTLRNAKFVPAPTRSYDDVYAAGQVISVSPNGQQPAGSKITIHVSRGPRMVTVPEIPVYYTTVADAENALLAAGLKAQVLPAAAGGILGNPDPGPDARVLKLSPKSGASVAVGSTVKLFAY
ncbi:protein kinase [uncultured Jatrophihabitans sp.]|uniref:protein kinase domain-containing protein n=1 Tax=uncultured Jatrophihabitans sp. TaxID=1610747 RepID=UPI0035CAE279